VLVLAYALGLFGGAETPTTTGPTTTTPPPAAGTGTTQ
jgi:hypothetical protein